MFPYPEPIPYPTPINTAVELTGFWLTSDGVWLFVIVAIIGIIIIATFLCKYFGGIKC